MAIAVKKGTKVPDKKAYYYCKVISDCTKARSFCSCHAMLQFVITRVKEKTQDQRKRLLTTPYRL